MNTTAAEPSAPRGRVQLLLLATLFFFPLLLSYSLYYLFPGLQPHGSTNYGTLIDPAQPLPAVQLLEAGGRQADETLFQGRWTYIVRAQSDCQEACLRALIMARQVRLAMNEKRSRIQRVLLLQDASSVDAVAARLAHEHPDLHVVASSEEGGADLAGFLGSENEMAIFLTDPHGNWMMVYPTQTETQADFKGMQKDIKRLLRLSKIG